MYNDPPATTTATPSPSNVVRAWGARYGISAQPDQAPSPAQPAAPYTPPPATPYRQAQGAPYVADPACVIRGTVADVVDDRTVSFNGEPVETATLLLETSPGRTIPVQLWGEKKVQYVREGLGRMADIVFTVSCQQRQVTLRETGAPTTIYNASLKLKSCLWA